MIRRLHQSDSEYLNICPNSASHRASKRGAISAVAYTSPPFTVLTFGRHQFAPASLRRTENALFRAQDQRVQAATWSSMIEGT